MPFVFLLFFIITCLIYVNLNSKVVNKLTASDLIKNLEEAKVEKIKIVNKVRSQNYEVTGKLKDYNENESFILYIPVSEEFMKKIVDAQAEQSFKLEVEKDPETASWLQLLLEYVPEVVEVRNVIGE